MAYTIRQQYHRLAPTGSTLRVWWTVCTLLLLCLLPGLVGATPRQAIVKIYTVATRPDYDNPWNRMGPHTSTGSGAILVGQRILTNAHVVSNHTYLQVRRHGSARKYQAHVIAMANDADLALLGVEDPTFFEGVTPLELGTLPRLQNEVTVLGFPTGGDTLSSTAGVVSRIEHRRYVHSGMSLLAAQLDAAINSGNSGGPVIAGNRLVGIVMQSLDRADNIGYMIPVPVVKHVLNDIADGHYDGFPDIGIRTQNLDQPSMKRMLQVAEPTTGVRITQVIPGSSADGQLAPGDVVTHIDMYPVADDGTVALLAGERTHFTYAVQAHQIGEVVRVGIIREGMSHTASIPLTTAWGHHDLVPSWRYDVVPTYYIYGGLVLSPLSVDFLRTWGPKWVHTTPADLLNYYHHSVKSAPDEEVVVLIKVLSSTLNTGYETAVNRRIVAVNNRPVRNLRHLVAMLEKQTEPFVSLTTEQQQLLVFERTRIEVEHSDLLVTYGIRQDRSVDMQQEVVASQQIRLSSTR